MTKQQQHPIIPPAALLDRWFYQHYRDNKGFNKILIGAAQWGADTELKACCEYLVRCAQWEPEDVTELRTARRPKPPGLKEQALALIDECTDPEGDYLDDNALATIRRALEQLDDN